MRNFIIILIVSIYFVAALALLNFLLSLLFSVIEIGEPAQFFLAVIGGMGVGSSSFFLQQRLKQM